MILANNFWEATTLFCRGLDIEEKELKLNTKIEYIQKTILLGSKENPATVDEHPVLRGNSSQA